MKPVVRPGLDVLRDSRGELLWGKRLGLITNHTGKTIDGTAAQQLLQQELALRLVALFSPEHGLDGEVAAGDQISSTVDAVSDLPLFSLYGATRKPTPQMLEGIDTLVFDVQDVGVRFYTYISTLKLVMEAAAEAGVELVVLDRPNPNNGNRVEGPVLDPRFASFIGIAPIPLLHGMTVGELALLFNGERMLDGGVQVALQVVPASGWRREMWWEDTGLPWRSPSPNMRTAETAVAYPALGLFEGVNVSEGRGTNQTFLISGAPWVQSDRIVPSLDELGLPGVRFLPVAFTPRAIPAAPRPIYPDEPCDGFRLEVTAPDRFQAVATGLAAIALIRRMYPDRFEWEQSSGGFTIDRLLGTDIPRIRLEAGDAVEKILASFAPELEAFGRRRKKYLLYP